MSSRKIEDLDPRIQDRVRELLDTFNKDSEWKAFITDGLRTQAEQNSLYAQGRTAPGKIVTWTTDSNHVKGLAVDIAFQKNGKLSYAQIHYAKLVPIARKLGFIWGGDWKQVDKPHFEMTNPEEVENYEKQMKYKGLDMSNIDSVKVAIDTWKDVVDGKYILKKEHDDTIRQVKKQEKDEYNRLLEVERGNYQSKLETAKKVTTTTKKVIETPVYLLYLLFQILKNIRVSIKRK